MSHIRCQHGQYCYLSISSTVAPWLVSWPIRNRQVWVVRRWQLASRRRLLQFACQPGASQGIQRDGDHCAPHCHWLRHRGCEVAVRLTYSPELALFFWWWTPRLHEVWKFSWLAVELLIAQEWPCDCVFGVHFQTPPLVFRVKRFKYHDCFAPRVKALTSVTAYRITWHSSENLHSRCDDDGDRGAVFLNLRVQLPTLTPASFSEVQCGCPQAL